MNASRHKIGVGDRLAVQWPTPPVPRVPGLLMTRCPYLGGGRSEWHEPSEPAHHPT